MLGCGKTEVTQAKFEAFLKRISIGHNGSDYRLFTKNCRAYSMGLLNHLDPDQPNRARRYLESLIDDQVSKSNWIWAGTAALFGKYRYLSSFLYTHLAGVLGAAAMGGRKDRKDEMRPLDS